jgi:diaminopimelate epimerase
VERAFKYHGLGNDFVVLDRRETGRDIDAATAQRLCDRRRGIGADGVLVMLPATDAAARMVVHNADGSVAEMCGNGIRCVVKHLAERGQQRPAQVRVLTGAGPRACAVRYAGKVVADVEVEMGAIAWTSPGLPEGGWRESAVPGFESLKGTAVSLGNPHLVLFDRPLDEAASLGPRLERHPAFPQRVNVEWARVEGEGLRVAVWERGAGLTQACGTGACAAVAAATRLKRLEPREWVPVALPGGELEIHVQPDFSSARLRGPATFVFETDLPDP